ncbi:MAG: hypothetical protein CL792_03505 [Chloroflexi bacterium]|nr:hypothetical protein [Chloroflexota bacterium]|tara:strand:+ start:888 stop:1652 length:765 start_codon:yes stop_codon:yes gene_type:complete
MFSLEGKHCLVTGAISPLQRAFAVGLAEAGANVSLTTLSGGKEEEVAANSILNECWSIGVKGEVLSIDLRNTTQLDQSVSELESNIGPIDVLVNATHTAVIKPFLEFSTEEAHEIFTNNVQSTLISTSVIGKKMLARGKGKVINVVSILADRGVPNCAIFSATQGSILGFTRSLGIEWIRQGVTVNALGLGFFADLPGPQQDDALREILEKYIPVRRLGDSTDLQGALVYLSSDSSNFVDSEMIVVDGAISVHA